MASWPQQVGHVSWSCELAMVSWLCELAMVSWLCELAPLAMASWLCELAMCVGHGELATVSWPCELTLANSHRPGQCTFLPGSPTCHRLSLHKTGQPGQKRLGLVVFGQRPWAESISGLMRLVKPVSRFWGAAKSQAKRGVSYTVSLSSSMLPQDISVFKKIKSAGNPLQTTRWQLGDTFSSWFVWNLGSSPQEKLTSYLLSAPVGDLGQTTLVAHNLASFERPYTISDRWLPSLFLKTSSDGSSTTSGGKQFHWLTVFTNAFGHGIPSCLRMSCEWNFGVCKPEFTVSIAGCFLYLLLPPCDVQNICSPCRTTLLEPLLAMKTRRGEEKKERRGEKGKKERNGKEQKRTE
ncbi:hypothetical protein L345_14033, partial [Ophiophagus hannah]